MRLAALAGGQCRSNRERRPRTERQRLHRHKVSFEYYEHVVLKSVYPPLTPWTVAVPITVVSLGLVASEHVLARLVFPFGDVRVGRSVNATVSSTGDSLRMTLPACTVLEPEIPRAHHRVQSCRAAATPGGPRRSKFCYRRQSSRRRCVACAVQATRPSPTSRHISCRRRGAPCLPSRHLRHVSQSGRRRSKRVPRDDGCAVTAEASSAEPMPSRWCGAGLQVRLTSLERDWTHVTRGIVRRLDDD